MSLLSFDKASADAVICLQSKERHNNIN